jgi:hypothetical protein
VWEGILNVEDVYDTAIHK